ncbi:MAG: hypothetical protein HC915_08350, partial [Anaerolineae bacterium]|nr:hypothetical protein [Anaerolineae bacterium]
PPSKWRSRRPRNRNPPRNPTAEVAPDAEEAPDYDLYMEEPEAFEEETDLDLTSGDKEKKKSKKKAKNRRRQLVYDEEIGEVVAKRIRKRGEGDDDYEEYF